MVQRVVLLGVFGLAALVGCLDGDSGGPPPLTIVAQIPPTANQVAGRASYGIDAQNPGLCSTCHALDGTGTDDAPSLVESSFVMGDFDLLKNEIRDTMPPMTPTTAPDDCDDSDRCATNVAAYIFCSLSTGVTEDC